jgi:hypothetical protein
MLREQCVSTAQTAPFGLVINVALIVVAALECSVTRPRINATRVKRWLKWAKIVALEFLATAPQHVSRGNVQRKSPMHVNLVMSVPLELNAN